MIKSKPCTYICGCNSPIFARKLCKFHLFLANEGKTLGIKGTPLNKPKNALKRSPLKRQSDKMKKSIPARKIELQRQWSFFMDIWDNSPHFCRSCSKPLGDEPRSMYFDHLLPKAQYPDLKFEKDNILLVCWQCHDQRHLGNPTEKHLEFINKAKQRFNI